MTYYRVSGFSKFPSHSVCAYGLVSERYLDELFENEKKNYQFIRVGDYDWRDDRARHRKSWEYENPGEVYPFNFAEKDDPLNPDAPQESKN